MIAELARESEFRRSQQRATLLICSMDFAGTQAYSVVLNQFKMLMADTSFSTYLKAFFHDWLTGMSGPLSVPFVFLALWVSSKGQKILYACLAVVCYGFASYRVWRTERVAGMNHHATEHAEAMALIGAKDKEIAALNQELAIFRTKVDVTLKTDGTPPTQSIKVTTSTNEQFRVLTIDYMTSKDVTIATKDMLMEGFIVHVPIDKEMLAKVWNTPRDDKNWSDHSGPAKIALTVSIKGKAHQFVLPVHMQHYYAHGSSGGTTIYIQVIGSKVFINQ